jgi:hypothetical protein
MSRHIDNLNRIALELRDRYGDGDEAVVHLRAEIEICEAQEAKRLEQLKQLVDRRTHSAKGKLARVTSRIDKHIAISSPAGH